MQKATRFAHIFKIATLKQYLMSPSGSVDNFPYNSEASLWFLYSASTSPGSNAFSEK